MTKTQRATSSTEPDTITAMTHGLTWTPEGGALLGAGAASVLFAAPCWTKMFGIVKDDGGEGLGGCKAARCRLHERAAQEEGFLGRRVTGSVHLPLTRGG